MSEPHVTLDPEGLKSGRAQAARTVAGLHPDVVRGFQSDPAQLRQLAEAIVAGQLG